MLKLKVFYCHIFPVKERNVCIYYSFSEVFIRLFNILDCIFEFQTNWIWIWEIEFLMLYVWLPGFETPGKAKCDSIKVKYVAIIKKRGEP